MTPHTAEQIMTRDVITVKKGSSIDLALKLMAKHRVSGLPVVDIDGDLVGILTESDLLMRGQPPTGGDQLTVLGFSDTSQDKISDAYRKARAETVEEAMTSPVIAFQEGSSVSDIARAMIEKRINRVPIVRGRKVVGIISRSDIIKSMASLGFNYDEEDYDPRIVF